MDPSELRAQAKRLKLVSDSLGDEASRLIDAANVIVLREREHAIVEAISWIDGFVFCLDHKIPRNWQRWAPESPPGAMWVARLKDGGGYLVQTIVRYPTRVCLIFYTDRAESEVPHGMVMQTKPPEAEDIHHYAKYVQGTENPAFESLMNKTDLMGLYGQIRNIKVPDCGFPGPLASNVARVIPSEFLE